jgi:hypothetical protein
MAGPISLLNHRRTLKAKEEAQKIYVILQFSINVSFYQEKLKPNYNFTCYLVWMKNFVCN